MDIIGGDSDGAGGNIKLSAGMGQRASGRSTWLPRRAVRVVEFLSKRRRNGW